MRRIITILTIILIGPVWAPTAVANTHHKPLSKCPTKNEGVVDADAQAVVYKASTGIFGCAYDAKHAYYLGPSPYGSAQVSGGTFSVTVVGSVVAYSVEKSDILGEYEVYEVRVRNLRTGKVIHRVPTGSPPQPGSIGIGSTTAIVVKRDGSVAWIVTCVTQLGGFQVHSIDKTGSHVLAVSPEIAPNSLALAGSTLYWLQGGKPMSATLD